MSDSIRDRSQVRRQMAIGSMILVFAITIAVLWCLSSDALADRLEKVGPTLAMMFGALIIQVGHYIQVGSNETKKAMEMNKEVEINTTTQKGQ